MFQVFPFDRATTSVCGKSIMIPKHAIGKVIGKGGARIDALAKIHCCELRIRRDLATRSGEVPLEIQSLNGSNADVLGVERDVNLIVSFFPITSQFN